MKAFKKAGLVLVSLCAATLIAEGLAHLFLPAPWDGLLENGIAADGLFFRDVQTRKMGPHQSFVDGHLADEVPNSPLDSSLGYFLTLHPYFGYALNPLRPGAGGRINKDGFGAPSIPEVRSADEISVGISGGSTAAYCYGLKGRDPLGKILNDRYAREFGRPFKVYNLALPGYVQPSVSAIYRQLGGRLHYFIDLAGVNEFSSQFGDRRLESPSWFFSVMNLYGSSSYSAFLVHHALAWMRHQAANHFIVRHSQILSGFYRIFARSLATEQGTDRPDFFAHFAYDNPIRDQSATVMAKAWSPYLVSAGALERAGSAHFILAIQPFNFSGKKNGIPSDEANLKWMFEQRSRVHELIALIGQESRRRQVEFSDFSDLFAPRGELFRDDCHFFELESGNGCDILAERLAENVARHLRFHPLTGNSKKRAI